jgi:hypothetical protein
MIIDGFQEMTTTEYISKKLAILNAVAPQVVALSKMKKSQQIISIATRTGSEYLANKWDGCFASRYLNSDSSNQLLWLKMMGLAAGTINDCWILHQAMLFFNNHSLTHCFKEAWLKRVKLNPYGNGENWCKLWIALTDDSKQHVVKFF